MMNYTPNQQKQFENQAQFQYQRKEMGRRYQYGLDNMAYKRANTQAYKRGGMAGMMRFIGNNQAPQWQPGPNKPSLQQMLGYQQQ